MNIPIEPVYVTEWEDFGLPASKKLPRSLYINTSVKTETTKGFTVAVYHDESMTTAFETVQQNLNGGSADINGNVEKIRFVVSPISASSTAYFSINDVTVGLLKKGGR